MPSAVRVSCLCGETKDEVPWNKDHTQASAVDTRRAEASVIGSFVFTKVMMLFENQPTV